MDVFIFDAGPLVTACKFSAVGRLVIDHILDHCEIAVATSVRDVERQSRERKVPAQETVVELVTLGFETLLQKLYQRYRQGEISFGGLREKSSYMY